MNFFKILCRNSIKSHWNIKVHLKYRSCMFVKTPKYDFLIFPKFKIFALWWLRIPKEDLTDVTLLSEDAF